ncbi:MAG: DUF4364 family protein [Oscillospiraceae bacterium]|nr:DUF4364 family protein [Oscillospiraceae bacterium]
MDNNIAFSAGVRFGGLTDRTEIKILICYLLTEAKQPLTEQQIIDTVIGQQLVNYFELLDALSHLTEQQIISETDGLYSINDDGKEISRQLEKVLPFSVRERAYKAVIEILQYETLKRQNKTKITAVDGGGYNLNCTIEDENFVLFSCDIFMPNEKSAQLAQESFIKYGQDIFKCVLGITTENPKMYKEFLENNTK